MRRELHYFDIYPKVVPAGYMSAIAIKCKERYFNPPDGPIKVLLTPMTELVKVLHAPMEAEGFSENGIIKFKYLFEKEQEYRLKIMIKENEWAVLSVYALEEDLYERIPLKGDTHIHTAVSDGWESPEAVAGYYRKAGFDFILISDHRRYEGAAVARRFYDKTTIDLEVIDGEEIHAPENPVHIVNFGGNSCISDIFRGDLSRYETEVREIIDSLSSELVFTDEREQFIYASCLWVYARICEAGGLAVLAHPHALVNGTDAYNVQDSLLTLLFKSKCFDALELVGGRSPAEVNMRLAFYLTACKKGYGDFPVLGGSDAHNVVREPFSCSTLKPKGVNDRPYGFNEFYTIVFAKANKAAAIMPAIKEGYSVAVDKYTGGPARVHGDYRLVSYALFLLSEYFPIHDGICYEEGRLMLQMAHYDSPAAAAELRNKSGEIDRLIQKYFK